MADTLSAVTQPLCTLAVQPRKWDSRRGTVGLKFGAPVPDQQWTKSILRSQVKVAESSQNSFLESGRTMPRAEVKHRSQHQCSEEEGNGHGGICAANKTVPLSWIPWHEAAL